MALCNFENSSPSVNFAESRVGMCTALISKIWRSGPVSLELDSCKVLEREEWRIWPSGEDVFGGLFDLPLCNCFTGCWVSLIKWVLNLRASNNVGCILVDSCSHVPLADLEGASMWLFRHRLSTAFEMTGGVLTDFTHPTKNSRFIPISSLLQPVVERGFETFFS